MNVTVWKFPLVLYDDRGMITARPAVEMPAGAQILNLQLQGGQPTVWALVDPANPPETRTFIIVGTGQPVPDDAGRYIGMWQTPAVSAPFVFHVFEVS